MSETATAAQRAELQRSNSDEEGKDSLILRPLRRASSPSLSKSAAAAATPLFVALFFLLADGPTAPVRPSDAPCPLSEWRNERTDEGDGAGELPRISASLFEELRLHPIPSIQHECPPASEQGEAGKAGMGLGSEGVACRATPVVVVAEAELD